MKNTAIKFHRNAHILTAGDYTIRHNFATDMYEVWGGGIAMHEKYFGRLRDAKAFVVERLSKQEG